MRNALNLRFCFLVTFLLFIPLMYALPPEGITIKGRVTDETLKEGVPGANVTVKGTSIGTITDFDGNFTIVAPSKKSVLNISFIGYVTQEIVVGDRTIINVSLKEDAQNLGEVEVVAIAYGNQDKRMLTSAVSSIDNKELIKSPATSITNLLAGALPGVSSVQTTGQPGKDAAAIYVRGVGSLNDSQSKPLVLVDGIEREFSQIDPNEIESISVLKDASSTAVFGVRGANGVVLITTRRGKAGKTQISSSTKLGLQQPISLVEQTGSYEFARFWNMKQEMDHVTNPKLYFTPEQVEAYRTGSDPIMYPSMDWKKYIFNNIYLQSQNNLNISGGSDNVRYFISVGYTYQNGLLKELPGQMYDNNYRYNRYNYRANIDANLTKTTSMKLGVGGVLGKIQEPRSVVSGTGEDQNPWVIAQIWSHPFAGPGFINGVRTLIPKDMVPLGEVMRDGMFVFYGQGYNQTYDTTLNLDLDITQKLDFITPGLSVSVKGAYDNKFKLEKVRTGGAIEAQTVYYKSYFDTNGTMSQTDPDYDKSLIYVPSGSDTPLTYSESSGRGQNWYLEGRINYDRTFGDHRISGLFLYNQSRNYYPDSYTYLPRNYVGLVGRATYAYQSKYLLDVNVGYNGSENFAPGSTRFGVFPSFSAGWIATAEKFMENQKIVDYLKLRASWGRVGNDKGVDSRFMYMPAVWGGSGSYSFGINNPISQSAAAISSMGNPEVTWETAEKQNYGIDLQLWSDWSITFDYFIEQRSKILKTQGMAPQFAGVPQWPYLNLGVVDNSGYELEINYNKSFNKDLFLSVKGNFSYNHNKVKFWDEVPYADGYYYKYRTTGQSLDQTFGYKIDWSNGNGYFNTQEELDKYTEGYVDENGVEHKGITYNLSTAPQLGDFKYIDQNGDGIIDEKDRVPIGYTKVPRVSYGLNVSLNYKWFDFTVFLQGVGKYSSYYSGQGVYENIYQGTFFKYHKTAWTAERYAAGQKITYPRLSTGETCSKIQNDFFVMDRAFIRLKAIELGYTLPSNALRAIGINKLRVYFRGDNLVTWDRLRTSTTDPEQTDQIGYPIVKTFNFGFNVTF